jgi:ATP-binding cassette subfamily C (CFTR/MRP) protein 1
MFAPAATFSLYALQIYITGSSSLDTNKAFTSLALISLVAYPASRLLSAVPNTAASLGCFDRIQEFLLTNQASLDQSDAPLQNGNMQADNYRDVDQTNEAFIVDVRHADISVSEGNTPVLFDVNISLNYGVVVGVTGPVGSGKTLLLKFILGEALCTKGEVLVQSRTIGYCSQTPWITHGTIKDVITGDATEYDALWYEMVLDACSLKTDLVLLPTGEDTVIGSRGIKLSGGQKQRIALARSLYARPQLFILDDTFSSLDPKTQSTIWARLFGDGGLFKKLGATVLVVTHSSELIVVLN